MDEALQHYGIKGMKWGIRRFQKENGELTAEGKKRYNDDKAAKKNTRRDNLISQLKKYGYSQKEAEAAADKRIKTQRIVTAVAGVTVAAAAAYLVGKNIQARTDQIIKAGDTLQRIEMQNTEGKLFDTFYAAQNAKDKQRYKTMLGYARQQQTGEAYVMKLAVNKDIKVASQKKAQQTFKDLYENNSEFRKKATRLIQESNPFVPIPNNSKKVYELFNRSIVDDREIGATKQFYKKLKDQGYGAIQDINDMKFTGYMAKNPLIFFEGANKTITAQSVTKLEEVTYDQFKREAGKAAADMRAQSALKYGTIAAAVTAANMRLKEKSGKVGKLSSGKAKKVNRLKRRGLTNAEIAKRLKIPEGSVSYYLDN